MRHRFSIGQIVDLIPRVLQAQAPGQYEIRKLMPAGERDVSDPVYRIKSAEETHERVAQESELTLSTRAFVPSAAPAPAPRRSSITLAAI